LQQTLPKSIQALLTNLKSSLSPNGSTADSSLQFSGISYDSRGVKPGDLFFCMPGQRQDGNQFAVEAIGKGAVAIVSQSKDLKATVPVVLVPDANEALSRSADFFFESPSKTLRVLGVTGTNGKTTTTYLIQRILNAHGKRTGLIGTLGAHWLNLDGTEQSLASVHTTPQAPEMQKAFAVMLQDGIAEVAMEVSSHSLSLKRVTDCQFAAACLTNITQDHLDFHGTMENYWKAKRILFELLNTSVQTNKTAVINLDDPLAEHFLKALSKDIQIKTYSWSQSSDLSVKAASFSFAGCRLTLNTPQGELALNLKLNGRFNVYNVMAAMLMANAEGASFETCKLALEGFSGVPGRFQIVDREAGPQPLCIVDYAHTPDGLENVLNAARALVPSEGKLIAVFGCGGDRDATKRPIMGGIAERLADAIVVTSDNPRSEDPAKIIEDILKGIKNLPSSAVEPDRALAIKLAVHSASDQDVIVVAGKGHENYQILADRTIAFDDRAQVLDALAQRSLKTESK
jgi:UDP-N-acetylmuramyl-tripeptide synthetase